MKCKDVRLNLPGYLEEGISAGTRAEMAQHLAECGDCRAFSAVLNHAMQTLDAEKETAYDPYLFTRIQAGIENRHDRRNRPAFLLVAKPLVYATIFIFLVVAGIGLGRLFSDQQTLATDYQTELYFIQDDPGYLQASLVSE